MTPAQRIQRILDEAIGSDLSSWEKFEFMPSIKERATLSDRQEKVLREIEKRIFEEED